MPHSRGVAPKCPDRLQAALICCAFSSGATWATPTMIYQLLEDASMFRSIYISYLCLPCRQITFPTTFSQS